MGGNPNARAGSLGTPLMIEISYADLVAAITAGTLIPGAQYAIIDYQTKHVIPLSSPVTIHTGPTEVLIVTALDVNIISDAAFSRSYPEDILTWDYSQDLCEDGVTPRTGRITSRKDTLLNNSTDGYDFRNVVFNRYTINKTLSPAWTPATAYVQGNIRYDAGTGFLLRCRVNHTSDATLAPDLALFYWDNITILNGKEIWDTTVPILGGIIFADTPVQVTTFRTSTIPNCLNNHIGKTTQYGGYNNITILDGLENVAEDNCYNAIINGDATFGPSNANLLESEATDIIISGCRYTISGNMSSGNVFIEGSHSCRAGNMSSGNCFLNGSRDCEVGDESNNNYFYEYTFSNVIGSRSNWNHYDYYARNNTIGSGCSGNVFYSGGSCTFGNSCTDNTMYWALYCTLFDGCQMIQNLNPTNGYGNMSRNKFGNNCTNIIVTGTLQYAEFGQNCTNITIAGTVIRMICLETVNALTVGSTGAVIAGTFGSGCANITLNGPVIVSYFGDGVNNITLASTGVINVSKIGANSAGFTIDGAMSLCDFGVGASTVSIGAAGAISQCNFGPNCSSINVTGSLTNCSFGSSNSLIGVQSSCIRSSFGNNNSQINVNGLMQDCSIGNNNTVLTIDAGADMIGCRIANNTSTLTVVGTSIITECSLENGCNALNFNADITSCYFTEGFAQTVFQSVISGVKFLVYEPTVNAITNPWSNIVVANAEATNGYWGTTIDSLGSLTTVNVD